MIPPEQVTTVARLRVGSRTKECLANLGRAGNQLGMAQETTAAGFEYGQAVLEKHGYQVDQRRRLISATLLDGRRLPSQSTKSRSAISATTHCN